MDFQDWKNRLGQLGHISPVELGMTQQGLLQLFGEPDDWGSYNRKQKASQIVKYQDIEFHFDLVRGELLLWLIYSDDPLGVVKICIQNVA